MSRGPVRVYETIWEAPRHDHLYIFSIFCRINPMSQRPADHPRHSPSLKLPKAILSTDPGNRYTQTTAPETRQIKAPARAAGVRAFTEECGMVRGQIKAPVKKKIYSPMTTDNRQQTIIHIF